MLLDLNRPARRKTISLTPLIDVVFILLLFFMLTSSFLHLRQIDVSAVTQAKQEKEYSQPFVVKILNNKGDFKLKNQQFSSSNVAKIESFVTEHPKAVYIIETEGGVTTQTMISLLDTFKQAGAQSVSLAGIN